MRFIRGAFVAALIIVNLLFNSFKEFYKSIPKLKESYFENPFIVLNANYVDIIIPKFSLTLFYVNFKTYIVYVLKSLML